MIPALLTPFGEHHPGLIAGQPERAPGTSALVNLGPPDNVGSDGVTRWLPPLGYGVDHLRQSLWEMLDSSSGSAIGQSAVSDWVGCPEYSRLKSLGVENKPSNAQAAGEIFDLEPMSFGTMMHALRAMRLLYGNDQMFALLERWRPDLTDDDYLLAKMLWRVYDTVYPMAGDAVFEVLGVECEVRTALPTWDGRRVIRTVRYDTVIRYPQSGELFSFECKTMARSGRGTLRTYYKQGASQMALWNANQEMVGRYGPMSGVLYDCLVKTKNPSVDRIPEYFSRVHQQLARKYLVSPEQSVIYMKDPETGRYPQNLNHCYQFFRPCQYVDLCWEGSFGAYRFSETGETYDGR